MHPIGCGLCLAGGGEDGARVVLQHAQPRCHVCGMIGARMVGDPEVGEHERSCQFGADLLDRQTVALEPLGKIAVEPVLCARSVRVMPISA